MELVEVSATESLEPISFRGSSEDKKIMQALSERLSVKPSSVPRIAIRILNDLSMSPRLTEAMSRVKVFNESQSTGAVLHRQKNVIRKGAL